MERRVRLIVAVLAALSIASTAWAATVRLVVKDSSGKSVKGATVSIGPVQTVTDDDGAATVEVAEGDHQLQVAWDGRTFRQRVTVRPGTSRQNPQILEPIRLPGRWLTLPGPPAIGFGLGTSRVGRATLVGQTIDETQTVRTTSTVLPQRVLTREDLVNSTTFRKEQKVTPAMGVVTFPLTPGGVTPFGAASGGWRAAGAPQARGRRMRFYPSATVGAGRTGLEFNSIDPTSVETFSFTGSALMFTVGGSAVLFPCGACDWFVAGAYTHARTGAVDLTRAPLLQTIIAADLTITRDEAQYEYRAHLIQATVGRAFPRAIVWGGARSAMRRAQMTIRNDIDYSRRFGVPALQAITFVNSFEDDSVEAIGGVDIPIARSPLFVRIEGSASGDNRTVGATLGFGLRR
jgi:hypothetical protein